MNAQLRIQIRIIAQQALAALKQVRAELNGMFRLAAAPVTGQINSITAALKRLTVAASTAGTATQRVFKTTFSGATSRPSTQDITAAQRAAINKNLNFLNTNTRPSGLDATPAKIAAINQALTQWNAQTKALTTNTTKAGGALRSFVSGIQNITQGGLRFGKSIQSAGRQLTYNFTYPLIQAGRAILTFELANETALTNLEKVYGDAATGAQKFARDQEQLKRVFRDLSDIYGVQQSDVIQLAASWAAAGATGYDLAKATETTMKALNLFDFAGPEEAVKALISVQTAYKLNADELEQALYTLNAVENATAVTGADLVAAFVRVGSTAESSGVGIKELAADMAALVPTTGSAETAGNALKTIFTRLMSPTAQAKVMFKSLGLEFEAWGREGATAQDRLMDLANVFKTLDGTTKTFVATQIAGRYQANRFLELMKQLPDATSAYGTALRVAKDDTDALNVAQNEINLKLASNPQRYKILQTRIQNLLAAAIMPMIPAFIKIISYVENLIKQFSNLSDGTKKWIVIGLVILAVIGPVVRLTGAFIELFSILGSVMTFMAGPGIAIAAAATPWILLAAAIVGVVAAIVIFRKGIITGVIGVGKGIWAVIRGIGNAFAALPGIVGRALMAVLNVIIAIGKAIYKALSYLNPFARHSPSLVEQVDAGVARIAAAYGSLSGIGKVFRQAAMDFAEFKKATAGTALDMAAMERNKQRETILQTDPTAGPAFDAVSDSIDALTDLADKLTVEFAKQKVVVDALEISLDRAKRAYDEQNDVLSVMKDRLSSIGDELDAAKKELDEFTNAPLVGMREMNDKIFENEMAQKKLRLEMMKLTDVGETFDSLISKIAALQGEINGLQGRISELRSGGAGSDILRVYEDQVTALSKQQKAYQDQLGSIADLQTQLEKLQDEAEQLDLEKSLAFDPLTHQIQNTIDTSKELTFDEVLAGIKRTKPRVDELTAAYKEQEDRVTGQQAVVDQYKAALDSIQPKYDREKAKLDDLGDAYDKVKANIDLLTGSVKDLASASAEGLPEGADFVDQAGLAAAGGDLQSFLDKLDRDLKETIDKMDPLAGMKKWVHGVGEWFSERGEDMNQMRKAVFGFVSGIGGWFKSAWDHWFGDRPTAISEPIIKSITGSATAISTAINKAVEDAGKSVGPIPLGLKYRVHQNALQGGTFVGPVPQDILISSEASISVQQYNADLAKIKERTENAQKAMHTYSNAAVLDIENIRNHLEVLSGEINRDQAWINLQNQFDEVKRAAQEAGVTAEGAFDHSTQAGRDYETKINNIKLSIIDLSGVYALIPPTKATEFVAELDKGQVQGVLDEIAAMVAAQKFFAQVTVEMMTEGMVMPEAAGPPPQFGHAAGTLKTQSGWTMLGERGRELVKMPTGSTVFSNDKTENMLLGGKSTTVNINGNLSFPNISDPNDADQFIQNLEALAKT